MFLKQIVMLILVIGVVATTQGQSVFDMPKLVPQHRQYLGEFVTALQKGNLLAAETAARTAVKLFPNDANWHYNVACVCAKGQRRDEALEWLRKAVELGFRDARQLQEDTDLIALRQQREFAELLERVKQLAGEKQQNATLRSAHTETIAVGSDLTVTAKNTQWNWDPNQGGYMTTLVHLMGSRAVAADAYKGPYAALIQPWLREGTAAGNAGDLYVNRDEDRTQVPFEDFPGLTPVLYSDEAQFAKAHVGAANGLFSTGVTTCPTVGLSSLSLANTLFWRSLPRLITTEAQADALSFRLAAANQLYVYDASSDYSAQHQAELLTALTTQFIVSGSQTATEVDVKAKAERLTSLVLAGLAAMRPETKHAMLQRGLLVPTVQMLLRQHVKGAQGYCTPSAHPTVFDVDRIDGEGFIHVAHALKSTQLPVAFQIAPRYESMPRQYIDYFDAPSSERISDTPWSIKRVIRGKEKTRKLTVSAQSSERGVTYQWFVVNGLEDKIRIRSLTKDHALVTLEVDYHGAYEQEGFKKRHVDIACVALRNGKPASAPCFVSFRYLANERRTYDAKGRIQQIDYTVPPTGFVYEDPALTAFKNWCDDYHYDSAGRLRGWTRTTATGEQLEFDAYGRHILEKHPNGTPKRVTKVSYLPRVDAKSNAVTSPAIELLQADTEHILTL